MRAALALMLVLGCAGGDGALRAGLDRAARALVVADDAFAPAYERARVSARERAASWEERDTLLEPWEAVREALGALRAALLMAEGVEGAELAQVAGCAAEALRRLRASLRAVGLSGPPLASGAEASLLSSARPCGGGF